MFGFLHLTERKAMNTSVITYWLEVKKICLGLPYAKLNTTSWRCLFVWSAFWKKADYCDYRRWSKWQFISWGRCMALKPSVYTVRVVEKFFSQDFYTPPWPGRPCWPLRFSGPFSAVLLAEGLTGSFFFFWYWVRIRFVFAPPLCAIFFGSGKTLLDRLGHVTY